MTKDSGRSGEWDSKDREKQRETDREMGLKDRTWGGRVRAGLHMSHQRHWGGLAAMP